MSFKKTALAVAALGLATSAFALPVTETFTSNVLTASGTGASSQNFSLNRFDTRLGTLTDVLITMLFSVTGMVDVTNQNATAQSFSNATSWVPVTLTGPGSTSITVNAGVSPVAGTVAAADRIKIGTKWYSSDGETIIDGLTGTPTSSTHLGPSAFSGYQGIGAALLNFTYLTDLANSGGAAAAGVYFGGTASATGRVSITYTYTPAAPDNAAPEPSTLAVLGLALGGLAAARRRRA